MTDPKKVRTFHPGAHVQSGWSPKGTLYAVVTRRASGGILMLSGWRPSAKEAWADAVRMLAKTVEQSKGA